MDMRDKLFPIFLKEAAKNLKVLQQFSQDGTTAAKDPEALEAAFRAAHTLKGTALLVQVDSVHQIGRRFEALLEKHCIAKTRPTAVEFEAMALAVAWLLRLLVDLQEGRPEPSALFSDAVTALEQATRYPGDTPLVELLDSDARQRAPRLSDPFSTDPDISLDSDELLRAAADPFADDADFSDSHEFAVAPEAVQPLTRDREVVASDDIPAGTELSSAAPLEKSNAAPASVPYDPFAGDADFSDEIFLAGEIVEISEPTAEAVEPAFTAAAGNLPEEIDLVQETAAGGLLPDPFADDFGFDDDFSELVPAPEVVAEAEEKGRLGREPDAGLSDTLSAPLTVDPVAEIYESLLLPGKDVEPRQEYHCCRFELSGNRYYLPIEYMVEIADCPPLVPLPLAPPLVSGLINLRSKVMPVIDLSVLEDSRQIDSGVPRLVVAEFQGDMLAFLTGNLPSLSSELVGEEIDLPAFIQKYKLKGVEA